MPGGSGVMAPSRAHAPGAFPGRIRFAEVDYDPVTFDQAVGWILQRAAAGIGGAVCTPNADYVVRAHRDRAFRDALARCDLRLPDGMAIIYAARLAGLPMRRTVTGRLLLPAVARASVRRWPIALFGAGPGVAGEAAARLREQNPGLEIAAAFGPPTPFEIGGDADRAAVDNLRGSGARVIFVALGAPRQELWIAQHRSELANQVLVGVGAALDIMAGRFHEAPHWMTRIGLEWAFRLAQEPRRLARRYLLDDPWIFAWAVRARAGRG